MGTKIYQSECGRVSINWFYGGDERGVCYQLNVGTHYIQLTQKEFNDLVDTIRPYVRRLRNNGS